MGDTALVATHASAGRRPLASLSTFKARLHRQQVKYQQRGGLFPVRFTGSFHDFTIMAMASSEVAGEKNPSLPQLKVADLQSPCEGSELPAMVYFNPSCLNVWMKRFHDYWLRLVDLLAGLPEGMPTPPGSNDAGLYSLRRRTPPFNSVERSTMIALLLAIFEKDGIPSSAKKILNAHRSSTYSAMPVLQIHC